MNKLVFIILALVIFVPNVCLAQESDGFFRPDTQIEIRYNKIDWQVYEFYLISNDPNVEIFNYNWVVDNEIYTLSRLRYYFEPGNYKVSLIVTDNKGNKKNASVEINVTFWSLYNRYFIWSLYGFVILIFAYYWVAKIIYLFNRRKVDKQAQEFLDVLDTHGWTEKIIDHIVQKHEEK